MSHSYIIYNGNKTDNTDSSQGLVINPPIYIETPPEYNIPEVDSTTTHVPGRNGDVITFTGGYKNVKRKYSLTCGSETTAFADVVTSISKWANTANGDYAYLIDTYDPGVARLARFTGGQKIENIQNKAAKVTVEFDCKPQRFLLSSLSDEPVSSGGTITNPYLTVAKPFITLQPQKTASDTWYNITVSIQISGALAYVLGIDAAAFASVPSGYNQSTDRIYIDCENKMVYVGLASDTNTCRKMINQYVSVTYNRFLQLDPGVSTLTLTATDPSTLTPIQRTIGCQVRSMLWTL